jgi:hypothetical protein
MHAGSDDYGLEAYLNLLLRRQRWIQRQQRRKHDLEESEDERSVA